jgi:hypothetical protein
MDTKSDNKGEFEALKKSLQSFQLERIKNTYKDLSQSDEYGGLADFFFTDIYGPHDFEYRNQSIKRIFNRSHHFLRHDIVEAISQVIKLNDMSDTLDTQMVSKMQELGIPVDFDFDEYTQAYRACDNYEERKDQINLLVDATKKMHKLSRMWLIGTSLAALKSFSELLGLGKIMNFLIRGYRVFHKVKNIKPFTDTILTREMELNDRLFMENSKQKISGS